MTKPATRPWTGAEKGVYSSLQLGTGATEMRVFLFCLMFTFSVTGFADPSAQSDRNRWYIDLGGKTVDVLGSTSSLAGVRAGVILPNNVLLGGAVFTLSKESERSENGIYKNQKSYSFVGMHAEYAYSLNARVTLNPGLLAGVAAGRYEERQGNTYGRMDGAYFSLEPSISLSVWIVKGVWLNLGASYSLLDSDMGVETGPSLNIFARYMW